jgi:hypothetical protein
VQFGEEATETDLMKKILTQIAAKQAPRILGEAGKTISDGDRERVTEIVGDRTITSNSRILKEKFQDLFNDIIIGTEVDINQALSTLNRYTGRNIGSALQESELSDEQRSGMMAALGVIIESIRCNIIWMTSPNTICSKGSRPKLLQRIRPMKHSKLSRPTSLMPKLLTL